MKPTPRRSRRDAHRRTAAETALASLLASRTVPAEQWAAPRRQCPLASGWADPALRREATWRSSDGDRSARGSDGRRALASLRSELGLLGSPRVEAKPHLIVHESRRPVRHVSRTRLPRDFAEGEENH